MKYNRIQNLLAHPVSIMGRNGGVITIPANGQSIKSMRVISWGEPQEVDSYLGVPIIERDRGHINQIDLIDPDAYHIVSTMVARELCNPQFISPNTLDESQVVRRGRDLIGVKSFQTFRYRCEHE